jgi:hypothetical protein
LRGNIWIAGVVSFQEDPPVRCLQAERDGAKLFDSIPVGPGVLAERRHAHPVLDQAVHVQVREDDLGIPRKPLRFREQVPVLVNHGMTVPGQIGCRLPRARRGIEIGGDAAGGLVGGEALAVLGLADGDVRGGEIADDCCAGHGRIAGGRNGNPDVLTEFHEELNVRCVHGPEQEIGPEGNPLLPAKIHVP